MASNISESAVYEANVVGPDDGDTANAASVRTGLQDLANRTEWLKEKTFRLGSIAINASLTTYFVDVEDDGSTAAWTASAVNLGGGDYVLRITFATAQSSGDYVSGATVMDERSIGVPPSNHYHAVVRQQTTTAVDFQITIVPLGASNPSIADVVTGVTGPVVHFWYQVV
jgi:hypothetical protein